MMKYLSILLLIVALNSEANGVPTFTNKQSIIISKPLFGAKSEISSDWVNHVMDFVELIDINQVLGVAIGYLNDPEVMNFVGFLLSPQFEELIWEFQSIGELSEALQFLALKGYDVDHIIELINSGLGLPLSEKIRMTSRSGKGISGLIEDIIATLPIEDMKKLFEIKLQTSPDIAELFEVINSEEFLDILRRMSQNPKFKEFKAVFEEYGFDFQYICSMVKEITGDYYQGIFCE